MLSSVWDRMYEFVSVCNQCLSSVSSLNMTCNSFPSPVANHINITTCLMFYFARNAPWVSRTLCAQQRQTHTRTHTQTNISTKYNDDKYRKAALGRRFSSLINLIYTQYFLKSFPKKLMCMSAVCHHPCLLLLPPLLLLLRSLSALGERKKHKRICVFPFRIPSLIE